MERVITIKEAKEIIDAISARDNSAGSKSEKRAKVLNKILSSYTIQSRDGSYNTKKLYSLDEIGYLIGTTMQYTRLIEQGAIKKIKSTMDKDENMSCDFIGLFA